jgi:ankyrin repeat protein
VQKSLIFQSFMVVLGLLGFIRGAGGEPMSSPEVPLLTSGSAVVVSQPAEAGVPPVIRAAATGDLAELQQLLRGGEDANTVFPGVQGGLGVCPLGVAASTGNTGSVAALLAAGADVNGPNGTLAPLAEAALGCHQAVARILLAHGASVNVARGSSQMTPLLAACQGACPSIASILLQHGANPHAETSRGITPLMAAAWWGSAGCLRVLLDRDPDLLATDHNGHDGVYFAALRDHPDCLKLLLDAGANVDRITIHGWSALMAAARSGCEPCVRSLIRHHADVGETTPAGWTALREAVDHCHAGIARLLIQANASVGRNGLRWPALETTVRNICPEVMKALLESVAAGHDLRKHVDAAAEQVRARLKSTDLPEAVKSRLQMCRDLLEQARERFEEEA